MHPVPRPDLQGIIAAVLTPIDADLDIDTPRLLSHIRSLLNDGCSMVSTFGTTGEGTSFSSREKLAAHQTLIAGGVTPRRILPAIMACALDEGATQLAELAGLGCPYVLVLPPFYYRQAPLAGLIDYFESLYRRAGSPEIGIVLYNIPAMSGITITHDLLRGLIERGVVPLVGVKDSTGDVDSGLAFVRTFPDLAVFTGDDRVLLPLVAAGGAGIIGGLPNLYAADLVAMLQGPEGPEKQRLAEIAAVRIADVDRRGGLIALKNDLAARLGDPTWTRARPPVGSLAAAS
jgi:4-hydroxy-tetrahydrodipicolinate synthase